MEKKKSKGGYLMLQLCSPLLRFIASIYLLFSCPNANIGKKALKTRASERACMRACVSCRGIIFTNWLIEVTAKTPQTSVEITDSPNCTQLSVGWWEPHSGSTSATQFTVRGPEHSVTCWRALFVEPHCTVSVCETEWKKDFTASLGT